MNGIDVGAAESKDKHKETLCSTKSTDVSSPNRTKLEGVQATGHKSCPKNEKSVSTTNKPTVVPTFKLTISGQVI